MNYMDVKPSLCGMLMKNQESVTTGKAVDWLLSLFVDPDLKQDSILIDAVVIYNRSKILKAFYNLEMYTTKSLAPL